MDLDLDKKNTSFSLDEFFMWKVDALRDYLSKRGLSREGTKQELSALCFSAQTLNLPIVHSNQELSKQNLCDYESILLLDDGDYKIPDPLKLHNDWLDEKSSLSIWPPLFLSDIVNFIITDNPSTVKKYLNEYKVGKAYEYFSSSWLGEIFYHTISVDSPYCLLRCCCTPSQRIKDESHKVWVCLKKESGAVKAAYCTCTAGLGQTCNHVAGLLFKVEHANKFGYTSCTSQKCTWNVPKKSSVLEPKLISEMTIKKSRHGTTGNKRPLVTPLKKSFQPVEVHNELDTLSEALFDVLPTACLFKGLPSLREQAITVHPIVNPTVHPTVPIFDVNCYTQQYLTDKFKENCNTDFYSFFSTFFKPTSEIIFHINEATLGQSTNSSWYSLREGRITASNFYAVHTRVQTLKKKHDNSGDEDIRPLLKKIMGYTKLNPNLKPLKYGREMEPHAKLEYKSMYSDSHKNASYAECGLFLDICRPYLSASPDLLVECDCCGKGLLEVKCPLITKCDSCSKFCTCILPVYLYKGSNSILTLKKLSSYYGQVQGQMFVTKRPWCDFFVYTCNGFFYERILYDEEFVSNMVCSLDYFFHKFVIPELFTRPLQSEISESANFMEVDQPISVSNVVHFCPICQYIVKDETDIKSFRDRSILCDACENWFHFKCVQMTKAQLMELSDKKWLCKKCTSEV
ncbi:hypothetical protein SNE40_018199 [Patella caerulea]|uniref:Uncharacterized protein n=1 Tax=Patella caerulea TaxID=87958 RepID=A0AAN8J797_PATCE